METSFETKPALEGAGGRTRSRPVVLLSANGRLRVRSALRLVRREVMAALRGPSVYLMVTLACLVAAVIVKSYLDFVADSGTLVLAAPLNAPLLFAVLAMTGYLGLLAAAGLAGERERGTLEVLFYGPVDALAYIGGKMLGHLVIYVLAIAALAVFLGLTSFLTGIPLGNTTLLLLAASTIPAASMIALGLLLAALVGRIRPALAAMALAMAIFIAVDAGNEIAASQPGDTLLGSAAGLLSALAALTGWISPFSYLWRAEDSVVLGSGAGALIALGAALLYGLLLTGLSIVALRSRGVQRWRE
ncbi:MAG: ABC transporter permease subunit [Ardenticatenaceae bacterium]